MQNGAFDYLITSDKNLQYQQNINKHFIGFIVLDVIDNNYETILPLTEKIKQILQDSAKSKLVIIS